MRHTVQIHYLCSHAWNQHNFTLQAKDAQNIQKICASLRWNMRWNEWWSYFGCSCNNIYHVIIIILFFFFEWDWDFVADASAAKRNSSVIMDMCDSSVYVCLLLIAKWGVWVYIAI